MLASYRLLFNNLEVSQDQAEQDFSISILVDYSFFVKNALLNVVSATPRSYGSHDVSIKKIAIPSKRRDEGEENTNFNFVIINIFCNSSYLIVLLKA